MTITIILVGQSLSHTSRRLGCGTFIFWAHFAHPSAALWALTLSLMIISSNVVHHFEVHKIPRILTPHLQELNIHITLFWLWERSMHACFLHAPHSSDTHNVHMGHHGHQRHYFVIDNQKVCCLGFKMRSLAVTSIDFCLRYVCFGPILPFLHSTAMPFLGCCILALTAPSDTSIWTSTNPPTQSSIWQGQTPTMQSTSNPQLTQSMNGLNDCHTQLCRLQAACAWHRGDLQAGFCSKIFENPTLCAEVWGKTAW